MRNIIIFFFLFFFFFFFFFFEIAYISTIINTVTQQNKNELVLLRINVTSSLHKINNYLGGRQ